MKRIRKLSLTATFLSLPLLVGCAGATRSYHSSKSPYEYDPSYNPGDKIDPIKVFDYFIDDGYPDPLSFEVKELNTSPFYLDENQNIVDRNNVQVLNAGASLYIYDVNNDGFRDFCVTEQSSSGAYCTSLKVYDYQNKEEILNYQEAGRFNYYFEINNNKLGVFKTHGKYNESRYGEGVINYAYKDHIKWDNIFDIKSIDVAFTYADPDHTEVRIRNNNNLIYTSVNKVSTYLLSLDVKGTNQTIYPDDFYAPISFISNSDNVVISNPLKDKPFTYALYFMGNEDSYSVEMNFSGISKTLFFTAEPDSSSPFVNLTLSNLLSWASQVTLPNIEEIAIKEEKLGSSIPESSRGIGTLYEFTDDSNSSVLEEYFDEVLFEVDKEDFNSDDLTNYTYIITTDEGEYEFEGKGNLFFVGDRCFMARKPLELNRFSANQTSYFFDREVQVISMVPCEEGKATKTIANPEDIVLSKKLALNESIVDACFTFNIRGATYYVLNNKKFLDSSARYVYEITSETDFSSLFLN